MKLEKKRFEDIVILRFVGEFDTFNLPLFSERVERMLEAGDRFYVLDVHLLTFINSSALGFLIKTSKRAKALGGEVVLSRPSKFVRRTLVTLGLEEAFPVFETDADAIQHFHRGADVGRLDLSGTEQDDALHGAVPLLFRLRTEGSESPPNQVGRIVNLYDDGLLFRYEPASDNDPVEEELKNGAKLKIKFRQPFMLKDYYFEMDANVHDVVTVEEVEAGGSRVMTVRVTYDKIKDDDRARLDQFVADQQIWRSEVPGKE